VSVWDSDCQCIALHCIALATLGRGSQSPANSHDSGNDSDKDSGKDQ